MQLGAATHAMRRACIAPIFSSRPQLRSRSVAADRESEESSASTFASTITVAAATAVEVFQLGGAAGHERSLGVLSPGGHLTAATRNGTTFRAVEVGGAKRVVSTLTATAEAKQFVPMGASLGGRAVGLEWVAPTHAAALPDMAPTLAVFHVMGK